MHQNRPKTSHGRASPSRSIIRANSQPALNGRIPDATQAQFRAYANPYYNKDFVHGFSMTITGTVQYQDIEGGFWGIVGDDNENYQPLKDLPTEYLSNGCRVQADIEPANVISFAMWGPIVNVLRIESI